MLPDNDKAFRKTLEQFKLVKPCEEGLAVEEKPRVSTTAHLNKRSNKKENPSQSHRSDGQTLFAYPEGSVSIENVRYQ